MTESNTEKAKKWIGERAAQYMLEATTRELALYGHAQMSPCQPLIDACVARAFADYREIVERFIKGKTGQLTTKDVAYYEQTRPSA